jgi:hypothetical protein
MENYQETQDETFVVCHFNDKYLIGNRGTVKSFYVRGQYLGKDPLKGSLKSDGYKMYFLQCYLGGKWFYAHRLVAMHFIPNINDKTDVNHIDGNRSNNYYLNLEWATRSENIHHSYRVLCKKPASGPDHWSYGCKVSEQTKKLMSDAKKGIKHPRFKGYYIVNGVKYDSSIEAEKHLGINRRLIYRYCKYNMKSGYSFEPVTKQVA